MNSPLFMMTKPRLKKIIMKSNVKAILQEFSKTSQFSIYDESDVIIFGSETCNLCHAAEITTDVGYLGIVRGDSPVEAIAALVTYFIDQEKKAKNLAKEALIKYEEINFLYSLSNKFLHCKTILEVSQLAMFESRQIIPATSGSVLLFNREKQVLEVAASWGDAGKEVGPISLQEPLLGNLFMSGDPEIINNVPEDERYQPRQQQIQSMISAPIKTRQNHLGIINLFNSRPFFYTANELRLIVTTGEQAGVTLENLMLLGERLLQCQDIDKLKCV